MSNPTATPADVGGVSATNANLSQAQIESGYRRYIECDKQGYVAWRDVLEIVSAMQLSSEPGHNLAFLASNNYVADREVEPREVRFADGRIVRVVGEGYLEVGRG